MVIFFFMSEYKLIDIDDNTSIYLTVHYDLIVDGTTWFYKKIQFNDYRERIIETPIDPCYSPLIFSKMGLTQEQLKEIGDKVRKLVGLYSKYLTDDQLDDLLGELSKRVFIPNWYTRETVVKMLDMKINEAEWVKFLRETINYYDYPIDNIFSNL